MAGRRLTDAEVDAASAAPVRRRLTDADVDAAAIPGPGKGDVTAPPPAAPLAGAGTHVPTQYGLAETALTHFPHGAVGEFPAKAGAFISAALGQGPEDTFGGRYDSALNATHARDEASAEQNPVTAGSSEFVGTVAPYVAGGGFIKGAGTVGGMALRSAAIGGVQGGLKDGLPGAAQGAAFGAALPLAAGARALPLPLVGRALAAAPVAVNTAMSGKTLLDPNATPAQRVEAGWSLATPFVAKAAERPFNKAPKLAAEAGAAHSQNVEQARADLDRDAAKIAGAEQTAVKDVDRQNAQTKRANIARTAADESAQKQDYSDAAKADRLKVQDAADRLRTADDATQRMHNEAAAKKRAADKAASDAHRLSGLDFKDEYAKKMDAYEQQKADADAFVEEARARGDETSARVARFKAMRTATESLRAAHVKEGDAIRAKMEELQGRKVDAAASAQAYFDGLHRELYDRATRHIAGSDALGQEPNSDIVASLRYLASKHESLSPEKFAQLDEYADPETHAEALRKETAKRAGETDAEMQGLSDRLNEHGSPDFQAEAQKQIDAKAAAKKSLEEEARAAVDAEDVAAGRAPLRAAPPTPIKPDASAHDQANRDFARAKILNGQTPLPPKPDRLATTGKIRTAIAALRNDPGLTPDKMTSRSDRGLIMPTREPIRPAAGGYDADTLNAEVARREALGADNIRTHLDMPADRTFAQQRRAETLAHAVKAAMKVGGPALTGGVLGGPFGAAAGAAAGAAWHKLTPPRASIAEFLTKTKGDAAKGEPAGFKNPGEAVNVLREDAARSRPRVQATADQTRPYKLGALANSAAMSTALAALIEERRKKKAATR